MEGNSTAADTTKTIHTVFTIEPFTTKVQWGRWVKRLEGAFKIFSVPDDMKSNYLLHYMGPESYDILCDKLSPDTPETKPYDELVKMMQDHYNPQPLEIAGNFRFR
ncbi:hypothetical protein QE152_g33837 [Popillia japonica]|uniref:Uncharacterized protein n=1 Tax=Popillia japonica TaxID=7064 RepID=A0AAW1IVU4_POPJA